MFRDSLGGGSEIQLSQEHKMYYLCNHFGRTPSQYLEQEVRITDLFVQFISLENEHKRLEQKRGEQKSSL